MQQTVLSIFLMEGGKELLPQMSFLQTQKNDERISGTAKKCHFLFYLPILYYLNAQSRQSGKTFKGISKTCFMTFTCQGGFIIVR